MTKKTPTAINGRGVECFGRPFHAHLIAPSYQAQHLTHKLGLAPAHAAMLAPMIYGSARHA